MSLPENPRRPTRQRPLAAADIEVVARDSVATNDLAGTTILSCCRFVIEYFLGRQWFLLFVPPDAKYRSYLTMQPEMVTEEVGQDPDQMVKMVNFAEMLLNLQCTPGFDGLLDKLLGGEIESTMAELGAGMAFSLHRHRFEYVAPSGEKGADYDVRLTYPCGAKLAADVKCKLDNSDYAASTIWNAFKKAKSQIPAGVPGMVFVRVPDTWINRETGVVGVDTEIKAVVDRLFKSQRFVLVVFYTVLQWEVPTGRYIRHLALEFENVSAQFTRPGGWKLFVGDPSNPDWIGLLPLISTVLERASAKS